MDQILTILSSAGQSPLSTAFFLLKYFGIPVFLIFAFYGGRIIWLDKRQGKYVSTKKYIVLAVDIPKENEQSPKAIENMFDQISGAHSSTTFVEKWWDGVVQAKFSFEIISIDGNVQFLIHTEDKFRDLIEAAFYAQYPDAEITEVEDYAETAPTAFPNDTYKLWGAEFVESSKFVYPIQTYPFFEHSLSQELKDPMSALMETLGSMKKGDNVWIQYIVTMTGFEWVKQCKAEIAKLMGRGSGEKKGFTEEILGMLGGWISETITQLTGTADGDAAPAKKTKEEMNLMKLTPGEQEAIKAIENKMGKIGFSVKMRLVYFAPKEVYSAARGVSAIVGCIKQFNGAFNGLKPEGKYTKTKSNNLFFNKSRLAQKQRSIINAFKARSNSLGLSDGFILNSEELATLYHFPLTAIHKSAAVKQVDAKKSEAPINLPFTEGHVTQEIEEQKENIRQEEDLIKIFENESNEPIKTPSQSNGYNYEEIFKKEQTVKHNRRFDDIKEEPLPNKNINDTKEKVVDEPPSNLPIG